MAQSTIHILESKVASLENLLHHTQSQVQTQAETTQQLAVDIEEDVDLDKLLDVYSTIYIKNNIAGDTVRTLFSATCPAFLPYLQLYISQLPLYYDGIKKSAHSLFEILPTSYELSMP
ncbi:hypothetical protein EVJ58_g7971 [Rhodofomes roseus]|uniref:Uncharacterized protein n=1 Tax=Rhodofomes roseus TaxID=34475 RepID=A0A4Y9Y059_9APHY|nr:hypothetical protein EVJ58_g7971 [Rhodofomes roseus]